MSPILEYAWTARPPCTEPFLWAQTAPGELIAQETVGILAAEFPADGFRRADTSGNGREKTYRNYTRGVDGTLTDRWSRLIEEIRAPAYRRAVADFFGQPVAPNLEIRLVRHGAGDWLSPHTDRADKLFSHIVYFNPAWQAAWGGCLEILDSPDPARVSARVVPRLGASALIARADNSWHQVSAVTSGAGARPRASLLIHGLE